MISLDLARRLVHDVGVLWQPSSGDRFVIDAELLTSEVFWVSDLTVEPQHFADQTLLGFNDRVGARLGEPRHGHLAPPRGPAAQPPRRPARVAPTHARGLGGDLCRERRVTAYGQ